MYNCSVIKVIIIHNLFIMRLETHFLAIRQSILAGRIIFSTCPLVRPSVRSSVSKLVNTMFQKRMNRFCWKLAQVVDGAWHKTTNFGDQVKHQGHSIPKLDGGLAEASVSTPLGRVWVSSSMLPLLFRRCVTVYCCNCFSCVAIYNGAVACPGVCNKHNRPTVRYILQCSKKNMWPRFWW